MARPAIKLLIIEDDPAHARLIRKGLSESKGVQFDTLLATRLSEGLASLARQRIDAVLLDLGLPDSSGLQALARLRERCPTVPVLVLTGFDDEQLAMKALHYGAQDYLLKGQIEGALLGRHVQYALERHRFLVELDYKSQMLQASERRFRRIIDQNADGILIVDAGGVIQFANPAAEVVFGHSAEDLVGQAFGFPIVTGTTMELDVARGDGEAVVVEMRTAETAWEGDSVYLASLRDVTQRKRMETELRERRAELAAILDNTPLIVILVDEDMRVLQVNRAVLDFTGKTAEGLLAQQPGDALNCVWAFEGGRGCGEGVHCDECLIRKTLRDTFRTGASHRQVEVTHRFLRDGKPRDVDLLVSTRRLNVAGSPRVLVCIEDVTERRRTERALAQQERLASVGQLAAGIAHDFNNILSTVLGYGQMMQSHAGISSGDVKKLRVLCEQAQLGAKLVRQILDFSRQSASERVNLDLYVFIKEYAKLLQRTIPETARILVNFEQGEYRVNADPTQIQQIVANLVVNAHDAMPEGGKVTIRLRRLDVSSPVLFPDMQPGSWVELSISDTGTGIASEALPRIFEPFFTTKDVGKGTGLGLSQVYGLVKQHEGFINVASEPGAGTTFRIYLPATGSDDFVELDVDEEIPVGSGETVLLVEDEPSVLEVVRFTLEDLNYRVVTAANGTEALALFDEHGDKISLILADVVMPEMGGMELVKALDARGENVKVILMTGYPRGTAPDDSLSSRLVGMIQKPLNPAQLAQTLRKACSRTPGATEGA